MQHELLSLDKVSFMLHVYCRIKDLRRYLYLPRLYETVTVWGKVKTRVYL